MKISTMENIRKAEIISAMTFSILANLAKREDIALLSNNIDFITIGNMVTNYAYAADLLTNKASIKLASDYKQLNEMYREVVSNIVEFYNDLGLDNPLSICGVYQYMYRKGYLSRNGHFAYSPDMKDIADLYGVDIIRGTGVCRSISSMLIDIYRKSGYESHGLAVRVENGMLGEVVSNTNVKMNKDPKAKKMVNAAVGISSVFHMANHVITEVSSDSGKLLLCPTNCLVLQKEKNKVTVANQPTGKVMYFNPIADILTGIKSSPITSFREMNTTYTAPEEHQEIMRNITRDCEFNEDAFEEFYEQNSELYDEIGALADKQHGLVKRLIPILPTK